MTAEQMLWERVRGGDAEALGELYEAHVRVVQSFCLWRTGSAQAAEDATATVFLEAWRKRERLRLTTDSAAPLLLGIANNVVRHRWRTMRRHRDALERLKGAERAGLDGSPEDEVAARVDALQRLREVSGALRALPRREQEVLALVAWSELTYEEAAAALGVPVGTVRSRLSRARARLGVNAVPPTQVPREEGS